MILTKNEIQVLQKLKIFSDSLICRGGEYIVAKNNESTAFIYVKNFDMPELYLHDVTALTSAFKTFGVASVEATFSDKEVTLTNGNVQLDVSYSDIRLIPTSEAPATPKIVPELAKFNLTAIEFDQIIKVAASLGLESFSFISDGTKIEVKSIETRKDSRSAKSKFRMELEYSGEPFEAAINVDVLKLLEKKDYNVYITSKAFRFHATDGSIAFLSKRTL